MYMWGGGRDGRLVQDELEDEAITLIKMDGTSRTIDFNPYPLNVGASGLDMGNVYGEFRHSNIHVINTKSDYRPWRVGRESYNVAPDHMWYWQESLVITPYNPPFPLGDSLMPSFPPGVTRGQGYDVAGLGQVNYWDHWEQVTDTYIGEIWLSGFINTNGPEENILVPQAKSWLQPPIMIVVNEIDATIYGYDLAERAFLIDYESISEQVLGHFQIDATTDSPVVNPTFLINNWGSDVAEIAVNGKEILRGTDFRFGYYTTLDIEDGRDWKDVLIVWVKVDSTTTMEIEIWPENFVNYTSIVDDTPFDPTAAIVVPIVIVFLCAILVAVVVVIIIEFYSRNKKKSKFSGRDKHESSESSEDEMKNYD